jgi:2-phospho-L-lactate/phosphoenolpyruvate guanylyltransferase
MPNGLWAVLPVKPFAAAKTRLDGALSPPDRAALARHLMLGALSALLESGCFDDVIVVSRDPGTRNLAAEAGAGTLEEHGSTLNQAVALARTHALSQGATALLVLASDLPLVTSATIQNFVAAAEGAPVVIGPDRHDEGTNALLLRPPPAIDFGFGARSFLRHEKRALQRGLLPRVLRLPELAFDVDTPADLEDLAAAGWRSPWLSQAV